MRTFGTQLYVHTLYQQLQQLGAIYSYSSSSIVVHAYVRCSRYVRSSHSCIHARMSVRTYVHSSETHARKVRVKSRRRRSQKTEKKRHMKSQLIARLCAYSTLRRSASIWWLNEAVGRLQLSFHLCPQLCVSECVQHAGSIQLPCSHPTYLHRVRTYSLCVYIGTPYAEAVRKIDFPPKDRLFSPSQLASQVSFGVLRGCCCCC